jgi:CelD/BcsL family acetyltransferase involved in cellulose biosynthesis
MSLRVDVVTSATDYDRLCNEWGQLLSEREEATPFETFEWNQANLISFENHGLQVLVFRDHDFRMVAVLPLVLRHARKHLLRRHWLEFAGLPYADYGAPLVRSGYEAPVAHSLVDHLRSAGGTWNGLYLDHMRQSDALACLLPVIAREAGMFAISQPTFNIRRLSQSAYIAGSNLGLQSSKTLVKARRKLAEMGEITFDVMSKEGEILRHLERYFQMHIERAVGKGTRSPFEASSQQKFFWNIVRTCSASGGVWLSILSCAGVPITYKFSLRYRESLHLYSTCFAPAYAKYSPSMLLLDSLLEYAFENGIQVVDFGMGDSPQKERAGAIADQQMTRVELYQTREAFTESRIYLAAQRSAVRSTPLRKAAKILRRLLPYQQ